MNIMTTYDSLCEEYQALNKKAHKLLIDTLNERGIESINVRAYMEEDLIDWFTFPQTDKHGDGVNVRIDTIRKDEKHGWVADVSEVLGDEEWDTLELVSWNFGASEMIDILGIVEGIFGVADDEYGGKVLAAGEEFDDEEE